jgi:pyrroline-5-carboxylate reductase
MEEFFQKHGMINVLAQIISEIRGMKAPFQNIAIIGGGNLGSAIAEGLLQTPGFAPSTLTVTRRRSALLAHLEAKGVNVHSDNGAAAAHADLLLLVVQPSQMAGLLAELRPFLRPGQIVVSLATGFSLVEIKEALQMDLPIYRAMPNTAVALRESMTCIATKDSDTGRQSQVIAFFEQLGRAIVIEENLMASATVLGACGIAYVMRFIRAASQGGIEIGFDAHLAQLIATQTVRGAAALLLEGGHHPEQEIDRVTTPRGCTIAGLNEMEHQGFSSALIKGITASHRKIADL